MQAGQPNPEKIFQIAGGFMAAKHLFVADEVGVFEKLAEGPADLDELARRTSVPRRTLRIITDAMVALGFVAREGDLYRNEEVAAVFLSGRTPADLRPFLRFWNQISYPRWTSLEDAVRGDQAVHGELDFTEHQQKLFCQGVEAVTAGSAQALASVYDFSGHSRLLDLGGGIGTFLVALLRQYGKLEGTLFELPPVAAIAERRLSEAGLASRAKTVGGDCLADPIPAGHDAVLVANVVHLLSPEHSRQLFQRAREASTKDARLLLVDFWTDPTHTDPAFAALMAGEFLLVNGAGDVYSEDEIRDWLKQTGWKAMDRRPLGGPSSLIIAEAGG